MRTPGFEMPQRREGREKNSPFLFESYGESAMNAKHPEHPNEDAFFTDSQSGAFGVFDGVGGHASGKIASTETKRYIAERMKNIPNEFTLQQAEAAVTSILQGANEVLYQSGQRENEERFTTASVVYIWEGDTGERKAIIGNVGDSRVYLQRGGTLEQITYDDNELRTYTENETQGRQLQAKMNNVADPEAELSENERILFKYRHTITQAIGFQSVEPRISVVDIGENDLILACSDGLSDNLADKEIEQRLRAHTDNQATVKTLIQDARARSLDKEHPRRKPDDTTAVIVECKKKNIEFKIGAMVRVQRESSGPIEEGWKIEGVNSTKNTITVVREIDGGKLEKHFSRAKLERINKPATVADIKTAENFVQLLDTLSRVQGLQGTGETGEYYTSKELVTAVTEVVQNGAPITNVTRTGGLREKVIDILQPK